MPPTASSIRPLDSASIHNLKSGQVIVDLQSAVKELVENSFDAGATSIEVRFKDYGLRSIEVVDNGSGIAAGDHDSIALNAHTSKLTSLTSLTSLTTFGFRGEALSSLCSICECLALTTATTSETPKGTKLDMDRTGRVISRTPVARQRGTTMVLTTPFHTLPVRRKELIRNSKREFAKVLNLLTAYALVPCVQLGARLVVSNSTESSGKKILLRTDGSQSIPANVLSVWGSKAMDGIVPLDISFVVEQEKSVARRLGLSGPRKIHIKIKGLISKHSPGHGRMGTDRQYLYVNGRPVSLPKFQKVFNEVYRSFNANQSPVIVADIVLPTDAVDINVSPDKRTVFIHSEDTFLGSMKDALEVYFAPARATYDVGSTSTKRHASCVLGSGNTEDPDELDEEEDIGVAHPEPSVSSDHTRSASVVPAPGLRNASDGMDAEATPPPTVNEDSNPTDTIRTGGEFSAPRNKDTAATLIQPSTRSISPVVTPNEITSSAPTSHGRPPPVQMVLRTEGASWNLRRDSEPSYEEGQDEPPRKKRKSDTGADVVVANFSVTNQTRKRNTSERLVGEGNDRVIGFAEEEENDMGVSRDGNVEKVSQCTEGEGRYRGRTVDDMEVECNGDPQRSDASSSPIRRQPNTSSTIGVTDDGLHENSAVHTERTLITSDTDEVFSRPEVIRTSSGGDVSIRFDFSRVADACRGLQQKLSSLHMATTKARKSIDKDASVTNTDVDKAADVLSRVIDKEDFGTMTIVGQFNKGFIITRRCKLTGEDQGEVMDDLFIVDQHAADEKYHFETLQLSTNIQSQKLLSPQPLELTAADELLAIENIGVLQQNGFEVDVDEEGIPGRGSKLKLVAQPVSKSTVFDMKDLEELIHLMHDRPMGQMVRCSKARAMFAMRACRKSVMVGMPLTKKQMKLVVQHMGTIDQPWNCPHGRPTMRHLSDIGNLGISAERKIDWATFTPVDV